MDKYLYEETRLNLVRRAGNFAVASLSCSIVLFSVAPVIALGLGFFAILFAFLSKGYRSKMDKEAVTAVKFAIAGIVIGLVSFGVITYNEEINRGYVTGESTLTENSDYATKFKEIYGVDPSEILNRLKGGSADE